MPEAKINHRGEMDEWHLLNGDRHIIDEST